MSSSIPERSSIISLTSLAVAQFDARSGGLERVWNLSLPFVSLLGQRQVSTELSLV